VITFGEVIAGLFALVLASEALRACLGRQRPDGHDPGPAPAPAPTRRRREVRCRSGKVAFDSRADADRVVTRSQTQRRERYDRPLQRSYRCPHCGHWHTTSQPKRAVW
jgi:hypothetical protein